MEPVQIRGRGAADNPRNRFERLAYEPDPEERDPDDPGPRTQFFRDSSRSIVATNDSPDVGFTHSVNPYRGCEHGCVYCLDGSTPILMADGSLRALADVRVGDAIYGTERDGWYRRYRPTQVLAHWETRKPAYRVTLQDGTELTASGDHRFLTERGWKFVTGRDDLGRPRPGLTHRNKLMGVGSTRTTLPRETTEYRRGYLCGVVRGDGLLAPYSYPRAGRTTDDQHQFRLALADRDALLRAERYLASFGVPVHLRPFTNRGGTREMLAIGTHARGAVRRIETLIGWPATPSAEWERGFLAGICDAEGSYSGGVLRISNTDPEIADRIGRALRGFGFGYRVESASTGRACPIWTVRLTGGLREHLRFLHGTEPAIRRKCSLAGQHLKSSAALGVVAVEPLGRATSLFDITTGTGDFIANGVVSHNCYARPTHEWLGMSAGLDFESRILVKEDAPELLRAELTKRSWAPVPLAFSGVTDCYQPIERKLEVTRRCVQVLAEFRNPVGIITKNHLVTRETELLAEMAEWNGAVVHLSVTTLDAELQRKLEPRASSPGRRLAAVEALAKAGVPVGVLVAPLIPGLTDHELPAILRAVADAGARWAGFVPLRLPLGVADLFDQWLERHYPDRRGRVMHRVREVRGGRLNDPRFGSRMRGEGEYADQLRALFRVTARRVGLNGEPRPELSVSHFRRPDPTGQLGLWG